MYSLLLVLLTIYLCVIYSLVQQNNVKSSQLASKKIFPQPTWRLVNKVPEVQLTDVLAVLSRFDKREDFYSGRGYRRPEEGLLSKELFYERISKLKYKRWPKDKDGVLYGVDKGMDKKSKDSMIKQLASLPIKEEAADAVFTSFAKGAANGVAYPKQVDEEMAKWLSEDGKFNLNEFQLTLLFGRFYVFLGWFLYIGLQFGGVYVVFFAPIMSQFFPEVDFYPVQTFLHTSEWGK